MMIFQLLNKILAIDDDRYRRILYTSIISKARYCKQELRVKRDKDYFDSAEA